MKFPTAIFTNKTADRTADKHTKGNTMNTAKISRRRFIGIAAAVAGAAALPAVLKERTIEPLVWRGIALGADAELRLYHPDRSFAQAVLGKVLGETERLEKIFSLYRDDSQLVRLNTQGSLKAPAFEMLDVLSRSRRLHAITNGTFDPTIQPLWAAYAEHFGRQPESESAPAGLERVLERVGLQYVEADNANIRFAKPGMALSFNGIAQGYITDRITAMLQDEGMPQALVDMGEIRTLDRTGQERIWRAGVRNPQNEKNILFDIPLAHGQALATSGGYGTYLDKQGRYTHLFDPHTGSNRPNYRSVSVRTTAGAAEADAFSTAFSVMPREHIISALRQSAGSEAWLVAGSGQVERLAG